MMDYKGKAAVVLLAAFTLASCGGGSSSSSTGDIGGGGGEDPGEVTNDNWGLATVKASDAWDAGITGQGVTIGVIDSGLRPTHEAFADNGGSRLVQGYDWVDGDADPTDEVNGHGTGVTSIAAGSNVTTKTGVAPGANIMPLRVSNEDGMASEENVSAAIEFGLSQGVRLFNLSRSANLDYGNGLQALVDGGGLVVHAAGNDGLSNPQGISWRLDTGVQHVINEGTVTEVAFYGHVICVLNVTVTETLSSVSNSAGESKDWCIAAPGSDVMGADYAADDAYRATTGTSNAAPHVAGAAALLWSEFPALTAPQVIDILLSSAKDLGDPGTDEVYGRGLLDIAAARALAATY